MVGLDGGRRAFKGDRFNHIRIEGPLGQETDRPDLFGLGFKNADKFMADNGPFFFRVNNPLQFLKEGPGGIHINQGDMVMAPEKPDHFLGLSAS